MAALSESAKTRGGRLIANERIAACARWQFASMGPDGAGEGGIADPQALREAHAQGHAEGYAAGRAQALAEAQAQMQHYHATQGREAAQRVAALLAAAEAGLAAAQQDIARGTLEIACALARQVLRHELATNPNTLEPVLREALALLLVDGKSACVRLSHVDYDMLEAPLAAEFAGQAVTVMADAAVAPGDCLIESAGAVVDGGIATRWSRAVASLGLALPWNEDAHAA
jgi:flagellar assembly protein FliH